MSDFYELLEESGLTDQQILEKMNELIERDKDFYDPCLVIADMLFTQGRRKAALTILKDTYEQAVTRIVDAQGRWPKTMQWAYLENRHLMRAIEYYANACWDNGNIEEALDIYRRLLRVNPHDNQGARYNILAIRMGIGSDEWQTPFEVERDGEVIGLDAFKVHDWFVQNAKKFPEEFEWFFKQHEHDEE